MMKPTDFSYYLSAFLMKFLPGEVGASKNTIECYRDTFILFLKFLKEEKGIAANNVTLNMISKKIVVDYLDWIEEARKCRTSTSNARLAALHSLFQSVQDENPDNP